MNNFGTNIESYSDLTAIASDPNPPLLSTITEESERYSIVIDEQLKKGYSLATKAVCIIGIATAGSMLIEAPVAPSQINLYAPAFEVKDQTSSNITFPQGYEIINGSEIISYFLKHPYLKNFLQSNLSKFKTIASTTNISLEYEGVKEEGWENLYVVIHLDNDDDEYINNIEDALFNELLNDVPEIITNNLTVSFA